MQRKWRRNLPEEKAFGKGRKRHYAKKCVQEQQKDVEKLEELMRNLLKSLRR